MEDRTGIQRGQGEGREVMEGERRRREERSDGGVVWRLWKGEREQRERH